MKKILIILFLVNLSLVAEDQKKIDLLITSKGSGHAQISEDASRLSGVLKSYYKTQIESKKKLGDSKLIYSIKDDSISIDNVKIFVQILNTIADNIKSHDKSQDKLFEQQLKSKMESFDFNTLFQLYKLSVLLNVVVLEKIIVSIIDDAALKSKNFILELSEAITKKKHATFTGSSSKVFIKQTQNQIFNSLVAIHKIPKSTNVIESFLQPLDIDPKKNVIAILSQVDRRKNFPITSKHYDGPGEFFALGTVKIYKWTNGWTKVASIELPVEKNYGFAVPLAVSFNSDGSRIAVLTKNTKNKIFKLNPEKSEKHVVNIIDSSNADPKKWKVITTVSNKLFDISCVNYSKSDSKLLILGSGKGNILLFYEKKSQYQKFDEFDIANKFPVVKIFCDDESLFALQNNDLYHWILQDDETYKFQGKVGQSIKTLTFNDSLQILAKILAEKKYVDVENFLKNKFIHIQKILIPLSPSAVALNTSGSRLSIAYFDESNTIKNSSFISIFSKTSSGNFVSSDTLPQLESDIPLKIKQMVWNENSNILAIHADSNSSQSVFGYQIYMFARDLDRLSVIQLWLIQIIDKLSKTEIGKRHLQTYLPQILNALNTFPQSISMVLIEKYGLK